jgi:acetyl-CoA carboxylase biotin carboxyl carrier protein
MATTRIKSEIAGTIVKIEKKIGDHVEVDDVLALLECMKMEIPIVATSAGQILTLDIKEGESIGEGQLVATLTT